MRDFLGYTILGIVVGSIYAVAASGLVVTYVTSGVFNIAHGAVGMIMAFLYWELRYNRGLPTPFALVLVVGVIAPAFGVAVERVLIRNLRGASLVTILVVTVGLMAALMGLASVVWPPTFRQAPGFFGDAGIDLRWADLFLTWHRIITVGVAVAVAVGLRFFLYTTRVGVQMRAVVDSPDLARLAGGRPQRAGALGWALGSSLAALAGILLAPLLDLRVEPLTLLVIYSYAAAMVGRLRSLPLTFAGGLLLGLIQVYVLSYVPTGASWLSGLQPTIPVIMLFVVLLVLPSPHLRGFRPERSREEVPRTSLRSSVAGAVVLVAVAALVASVLAPLDLLRVSQGLALGIVMLSLVLLTGYGGQISLGHLAFAGIGAWVMAEVGGHGSPLGLLAAAAVAALVGGLIALPALRLQGLYLALATLAFAVACEQMLLPQKRVLWQGGVAVPRLDLPGVSFDGDRAYFVLLAVVFGLLGIGLTAIRRGPLGRRLLAMKDSPAACSTLGLDLTRTKLQAFALSAAIAGLGGALYGGLQTVVGPSNFTMVQGLPIVLMAVVGGIGYVSGALLGGMVLASIAIVGHGWPGVARFLVVGPGLIGISLGRNPNGAVADILRRVGALWSARGALPGRRRARDGEPLRVPDDLGLDSTIRPEDLAALDRALAIDEVFCDVPA